MRVSDTRFEKMRETKKEKRERNCNDKAAPRSSRKVKSED
jgi:hypothetical protein